MIFEEPLWIETNYFLNHFSYINYTGFPNYAYNNNKKITSSHICVLFNVEYLFRLHKTIAVVVKLYITDIYL